MSDYIVQRVCVRPRVRARGPETKSLPTPYLQLNLMVINISLHSTPEFYHIVDTDLCYTNGTVLPVKHAHGLVQLTCFSRRVTNLSVNLATMSYIGSIYGYFLSSKATRGSTMRVVLGTINLSTLLTWQAT
jgi:hypothetical protein